MYNKLFVYYTLTLSSVAAMRKMRNLYLSQFASRESRLITITNRSTVSFSAKVRRSLVTMCIGGGEQELHGIFKFRILCMLACTS